MEPVTMNEAWLLKTAAEAIRKAQKLMRPGFFKRLFSSLDERMDSARSNYSKAANCYKLAHHFKEAGECFKKVAELEPSSLISAHSLIDAANSMIKADPEEGSKLMTTAIELYAMNGNFRMAAKYTTQTAEMLVSAGAYGQAVTLYNQAADYEEMEGESKLPSKNLESAADLIAEHMEARIPEAIALYEKILEKLCKNDMLKRMSSRTVFRLFLLYLSIDDIVGAERVMAHCAAEDLCLPSSREHYFMQDLLKFCREGGQEEFEKSVYDFHRVSPLGKLDTLLLLRIKTSKEANENDIALE